MAQVKLDISEYELMKENAKLLEKSLNRERDLQQKNEELVKEKIKALEEAKMRVVKITKTKSVEHLYRPRGLDRSRVFREIEQVFSSRHQRGISERMLTETELDQIQDALFERDVVESTPKEYHATIGLDEAKAEIKADYEASMAEEHRKNRERVEQYGEESVKMHQELSRLRRDNDSYIEEIEYSVGRLLKEKEEVAELSKVLNEKAVLMVDVINLMREINFFNKKRIIKEVLNKL